MYTYVEIKATANQVLTDPTANKGTKQLAVSLATLAERTMRLEERQKQEIERLEKALKALLR